MIYRTTDSTLVIISVFAEVQRKFRRFFSRETSASLRDLDDKLLTQLVLSTKDAPVGETESCVVDSFWCYDGLCRVLDLILSSSPAASSGEKADFMHCFLVYILRGFVGQWNPSLRNLMNISSANRLWWELAARPRDL